MKNNTSFGSLVQSRLKPPSGTLSEVVGVVKRVMSALMLAFFVLTQLAYPFVQVAQAQEVGRSAPTNVFAATSTRQLDVVVSTSTTGLLEYTPTANESADSNLILQKTATVVVAESIASTSSSTDSNIQTAVADEPNFQDILAYLRELQMMDKSELSKAEKEELKAIKREAKEKIEGIDLKNFADTELRALKLDKKSKERDLKNALGEVDLKKKKGKELTVEQKELQKQELDKAKKKKLKEALVIQTKEFESLVEVNAVLREQYFAEIEATLTEEERMHAEIPDAPVVFVTDEVFSTDDYLLDSQPDFFLELYAQSDSSTTPIVVDRPIVVAVIDAGVDYTHEDLQGMMWRSDLCASFEGERLPQSCENGYDFVGNDYNPAPTDGSEHGTGVASMIAAMSGNGVGISSLSSNRARIMSLRVADNGYIYSDTLVKAIYFAVYNGADIINMSLSGPAYNQEFADAVAYAQSMGVVVVASAGNASLNIDETPVYPASLPGVITVGAADSATTLASWSNYGETVDLVAPGHALLGAGNNNTYRGYTGTSFSAPMVTSLLVRKISEGVAPAEFIAHLPSDDNFAGKSYQGKVLESVQFLNGVPLSESENYSVQSDGTYTSSLGKGGEYELVATVKDSSLGFASPVTPGSGSSGSANTIPTGNVKFTWSKAATTATQYGLYVRDTVTNTLVVDQDNLGKIYTKSIAGSTFIVGRKYKWNTGVSKTNTAQSSATNYSDPLYFVYGTPTTGTDTTTGTTGSVPSAPTLTFGGQSSPGTKISATTYTISWPTVAGATRYEFQLADLTNNPSGSHVGSYAGSGNSTERDFLVNGHFYKYQVRAKNAYGWGDWSAFRYFYVQFGSGAYLPPSTVTPSHTSPPGNSLTSTTYQVSWQNTGAPQYNLTWSKKQADGSYCYAVTCGGGDRFISGTSYTIDNLVSGGYYRFDVASCPSVGGCTNSTARSSDSYFYVSGTANIPPTAPNISGLQTLSTNSLQSFTFSSSDSDGDAFKYEIDWNGLTSPSWDTRSGNVRSAISSTTKYNATGNYCIRARAIDTRGGDSGWSSCHNVTVTTKSGVDIVPSYLALSTLNTSAGTSITVDYRLKNIGNTSISPGKTIPINFYLTPKSGGMSIDSDPIHSSTHTFTSGLSAGIESTSVSRTFNLPSKGSELYTIGSGEYNIIVSADDPTSMIELNEYNLVDSQGVGKALININGTRNGNDITIVATPVSGQTNQFDVTVTGIGNSSDFTGKSVSLSTASGHIISPATLVFNSSKIASKRITVLGGFSNQMSLVATAIIKQETLSVTAPPRTVAVSTAAGNLTTIVVYAQGDPYANKPVEISCSSGTGYASCTPFVVQTDALGRATVNLSSYVSAGFKVRLRVAAVSADVQYTKSKSFDVTANKAELHKVSITTKFDNVHNPVIFLPGIMGSSANIPIGDIIPRLPDNPDAEDLILAGPEYLGMGFGSLKKELQRPENGYVEGQTIFECPYDWRSKAIDNAYNYLRQCIDKALSERPVDSEGRKATKVDIVAHSMGGLVTRALIQSSDKYANKVNSVAFVGSPLQGAAMAYPVWEFGDLSIDPTPGASGFGEDTARNIIIYSAMKAKNYTASTPQLPTTVPGIFSYSVNTTQTVNNYLASLDKESVRRFVQEYVPSLKELLPTYGNQTDQTLALVRSASSYDDIKCHENKFLKRLNGQATIDSPCYVGTSDLAFNYKNIKDVSLSNGVRFGMFYGGKLVSTSSEWTYANRSANKEEWTRARYPVGPAQTGGVVNDGLIASNYKTEVGHVSSGDGTVPMISSYQFALDNSFAVNIGKKGAHGKLVDVMRSEIATFITGNSLPALSSLNAVDDITVQIGVSGGVTTALTGSVGGTTGIDQVTDIGVANNPKVTDYTVSDDGSSYGILNPGSETFTLKLFGGTPGQYFISLSFSQYGALVTKEYEVYYSGTLQTYTLSVDPQATSEADVIGLTDNEKRPSAVIIAKTADGKSELSWTAPVGVSVQKYKVYSRPVVNPTLMYLGETTATTYSTGISWGGVDNEATRRFQVSAVLTNGVETFLSEPVFDNDIDGDLLIDSMEASIGTNPAVKDTDGDGRDDAQEYYVDKTNPLVVDQAPSTTITTEIPVTDGANVTQAYGANPFSLGAVFTATSSANTYGTLVMGTLIGPRKFASLSMQADGKLHAEIAYHSTSGANVGNEFVTTQTYKDGMKHYVELAAHNKTATNSEIILYVDGVEVKRQTAAHAHNYSTPLTNYRVGEFQLYTTSALTNSFKGVIDKAVTFVGTRTPESIMQTKNLYLSIASSSSPSIPLIGSQINDGSGTSTAIATSSLSIGSWFTASSTGTYGVLASGAKGDNSRNFLALWYLPDGRVGAELGANVNMEMYATSTWADSQKHYVEFALANVGTQKVGALYIDGLLRASATTSGNYNLPAFARWQLGEFTGLGATGVQHQFSGVRGEAHSAHIVTGVRTASDVFAYYNSIVNPTPPAPPVVTTSVTDGANITSVIGSQSFGLGSWFKTGSVSQESALVGATHMGSRSFTVLKLRTDGKVVGEFAFIDAQGNNQGVEVVSANAYANNTLHYAEMVVKNLGASVEVKLYVDGVLAGTQTFAGSYTLAQYDSWTTKRMKNWSNGTYNMAYGGSLGAQYFYLGERSLPQSLTTYQSGNPITLNEFTLDAVPLDPAPVATSTTSGVKSSVTPSTTPTSESEVPANSTPTIDTSTPATLPEPPPHEPVTDTVVQ